MSLSHCRQAQLHSILNNEQILNYFDMITNRTIILEQPKKLVSMIMYVNLESWESRNENTWRLLGDLSSEYDLIFIFEKDMEQVVDVNKFTSLTKAIGYTWSSEDTEVLNILGTLEYCEEVLERFSGYLYLSMGTLIDRTDYIDPIQNRY